MNKFLIIDGNSIMNRAFYGVLNGKMLSTKEGVYTNAIYGFLNIYWMILEKLTPNYVAVSFDLKAPTFRHEMFADYKATRKGMPDELRMQMPIIKEVLQAMTVPIIEIEGFEADDVLGTVARVNEQNGIFTYILTGDKDSFQLISDNTSIVIPTTKMGKTEYTMYTPELLKEKFEIEPYQVVHVKALMGDASDNIPGVKGIGEKTAYSIINKYGTVDYIYDNIDEIDVTAKIKEKLLADKEMAYTSKTLATIERNVPIEVDYSKCTLTEVDKPKLYELFKRLEFNKFINKFDFSDVSKNEVTTADDKSSETAKINNSKLLSKSNIVYITDNDKELFESILKEDKLSYFFNPVISNAKNANKDKLGINEKILAIYSDAKDTVYIINSDLDYSKELIKKFALSETLKLGYNIKQDLHYIFNNISDDVVEFKYDLMIAYYLMDSNRTNYDIEYIFSDLYGSEMFGNLVSEKEDTQMSLFGEETNTIVTIEGKLSPKDEELLTKYLKGVYLSYNIIIDKLTSLNMLDLFNIIEVPLAETLAYMECTGMYIDIDKLDKFNLELCDSISKLEADIYAFAGENFNINSTQQLGNILFNKLNLPVVRKTKTGYSTDKEVLEELSDHHEIVDKVLEYRQLVKLKTTYVDGLKSKIDKDGRIHTTFMQTVASTGRLSSVEPNLQNIPVRLELGKKIRSFFVGENNNVIIDADYSQIELRVLADISKDQTMINAFNNNIDIHTVTASQVFDTEISEVTKAMRSKAKAVNFGIVYGISEFGLAKNIGSTRKEASTYIENYLTKYSGIKSFMDNIVKEAKLKGYVTTLFNRRRYIPELSQKNKNIIQFGERVAMNTPIQGTAADIIKLAMNKIYIMLKARKLASKLIMQVHDELIIEAIPGEEDIVKDIMRDAMENVIKLKVPLDIDLNVGKSWYDTK